MPVLHHQVTSSSRGYSLVAVLVFVSIAVTSLVGFTNYISTQFLAQQLKDYNQQALHIAEAGLEYYRWYLAHNPGDVTHGTGSSGPYTETYTGPEGDVAGTYELSVNANTACGVTRSIEVSSTGWHADEPDVTRTVRARYSRTSVAEYAYIINDKVWAGASRNIVGRYHSNDGIRMDGDNQSVVTSAVETWECTPSFGCSTSETKPGIFGAGAGDHLWQFPAPQVDFAGITVDLAQMKTKAQSTGTFLPNISGGSDQRGYHLIFQSDGTVDVYEVTDSSYFWGQPSGSGSWQRDYHYIVSENFVQTVDPSDDCALIYAEDKMWLEGDVADKVTVASADVADDTHDPSIVLADDLTYQNTDGSHGLTAVAESSVLISAVSPDRMTLNGIFIAQNGHFGRNYYSSYYAPYHTRDELEIVGSIISNGRVGTSWSCGGSFCSGYSERRNAYDGNLADNPPPLTPFVSDDYSYSKWREVEQ